MNTDWLIKATNRKMLKYFLKIADQCGYDISDEIREEVKIANDIISIGLCGYMPNIITTPEFISVPIYVFIIYRDGDEFDNEPIPEMNLNQIEFAIKNYRNVVDNYISNSMIDLSNKLKEFSNLKVGESIPTVELYNYFNKLDAPTFSQIIGYSIDSHDNWEIETPNGSCKFKQMKTEKQFKEKRQRKYDKKRNRKYSSE